MSEHLVIPDTQVKSGVPTDHLVAAGRLAVDRKPEVIIFLGDHWDFPSLGTHNDRGSVVYHNKSYIDDLQAGIQGMEGFLHPIEQYNKRRRKNKKRQYSPRMVFTLGNHEYRRNRMEDNNPKIRGALPTPEDYLHDKGFEVYPFKQAIKIGGVNYSHLCPQTKSAGAVERAHLIVNKRHESWTVGHSQGFDYFLSPHEPRCQALITGSFYQHDEDYKAGSNDHFRGLVYKYGVRGGSYDLETVSIDRLLRDYS